MSKVLKGGNIKPNPELFQFPELADQTIKFSLDGELAAEPEEPDPEELLRQAEEQAERIRAEAERELTGAKQEAESIRRQAREQGFAEGQEHAQAEALKRLTPLLANFQKTLQNLGELQRKVLKESESEIVALAMDIARRIIGAQVAVDQATAAKVISTALEKIGLSKNFNVRVNPADYAFIKETAPEGLKGIELSSDPEVERGGAVIDTPTGSHDAQLSTQMVMIEQLLKGNMVQIEGE